LLALKEKKKEKKLIHTDQRRVCINPSKGGPTLREEKE
jgi:hypothetical protein